MSEAQEMQSARTPWHLWVVGVLWLLWSAMGCLDYVMTETENAQWAAGFTKEQLDYFYNFPAWVVAFWATSVWGGLVAAVLLLLRRKWCVWLFAISLLCMVPTTIYCYGLSEGMEMMGTGGLIFTVIIFVLSTLVLLYSHWMKKRGVLR